MHLYFRQFILYKYILIGIYDYVMLEMDASINIIIFRLVLMNLFYLFFSLWPTTTIFSSCLLCILCRYILIVLVFVTRKI